MFLGCRNLLWQVFRQAASAAAMPAPSRRQAIQAQLQQQRRQTQAQQRQSQAQISQAQSQRPQHADDARQHANPPPTDNAAAASVSGEGIGTQHAQAASQLWADASQVQPYTPPPRAAHVPAAAPLTMADLKQQMRAAGSATKRGCAR